MKIFKSSRGISNQWMAIIPVAVSGVIIWLPAFFENLDPILILAVSFTALTSVFFLLLLLPKQAIAVSCDDFTIANCQTTLTFDELTTIEMIDCGQIEGFKMTLRDDVRKARPITIPFSQIQGGSQLLEHIRRNSERAIFLDKPMPFGSFFHWLLALAISALLAGAARLVLQTVA